MPRSRSVDGIKRSCRNVCFVTGTRAEFGLMRSVLQAIEAESKLRLQIVATGMHLDPAHGSGIESIQTAGWRVDRVIPWPRDSGRSQTVTARNTGLALAALAGAFEELASDVVLVVGDRVEAFAAASAAHLSGRLVAHVHGGDRAAGQVDDSLRHAISKLAHLHFPATRQSAQRLYRLGEDRWRIHRVGSPGLDGIVRAAAPMRGVHRCVPRLKRHRYALLLLHPVSPDASTEFERASALIGATAVVPYQQVVIVYPNNDPGNAGIARCWQQWERRDPSRTRGFRDLPRSVFLGLMRDAAVLAGNSSSGIIEASSFGTAALDIGPRQQGRERGKNVMWVPYQERRIRDSLVRLWNGGRPVRFRSANIYQGQAAGRAIAQVLAKTAITNRVLRKLVRY